eukprot:1805315-Pleurochrysis_carterae.AAC.2
MQALLVSLLMLDRKRLHLSYTDNSSEHRGVSIRTIWVPLRRLAALPRRVVRSATPLDKNRCFLRGSEYHGKAAWMKHTVAGPSDCEIALLYDIA